MSPVRVLCLEPYYGGSHKAVLDCLTHRTNAEWTLVTLPPRKWKWRMRGAAMSMSQEVARLVDQAGGAAPWDLVFCSTFLNLAEFKGLVGQPVASLPSIVYFHENQLSYPNRHTAEWDLQFPLTNITSALSADECVFNTRWNRDEFIDGIPEFIRQFPDHRPQGLGARIAKKSTVLAPPFDADVFDAAVTTRGDRCKIVWPHRWEHDKNPEEFFSAVMELAGEGLDFEVAVVGQSFRETEALMLEAASALGDRLVHCSEPKSRAEYASIVASSDVAVSTALNEFFGLAMIEACYVGCTPLVPDRLAYPEVYPEQFRFSDRDDLVEKLRTLITQRPVAHRARQLAELYTISALAPRYDALLNRVGKA